MAINSHSKISSSSSTLSKSIHGTLYVVATPIGNLEDVTLRALRVLKEVSIIASEDTRRTAKLLRNYNIETKTISFHQHNEIKKGPYLLSRLQKGDSIALVTDAGTPLLSDPGARLVRDAIELQFPVQAIPGASAILAALVTSGLVQESFIFAGFPPNRSKARKKWFSKFINQPNPLIIFEAPHRIRMTLTDMMEVLGNRKISICREMTKIHESFIRGSIEFALENLKEKGEFTIVVAPQLTSKTTAPPPKPENMWLELCRMTKNGDCDRRTAVNKLAKKYQLSNKDVYKKIEKDKTIGHST